MARERIEVDLNVPPPVVVKFEATTGGVD